MCVYYNKYKYKSLSWNIILIQNKLFMVLDFSINKKKKKKEKKKHNIKTQKA